MRAMLLDALGTKLREAEIRRPELRPGEVRLRVHACGVCRTDLHTRDGELTDAKLPLILGYQIVGSCFAPMRLRSTTQPESAPPPMAGGSSALTIG